MSKTLPNIQLFGERVLFEPVEEEIKGSILLPQKANKSYELGRVLQVGNGKVKDKDGNVKETPLCVKPGDIVWFQVNPMMAANCAVRFNGKTYLNVLQHDIIAKLKSTVVSIEDFEVLGYWVLLDSFEDKLPSSQILLPDTANTELRALRYVIKQKGVFAKDVEVGQEVVIEKRAAQLVSLNDEPYFYMDSRHVHGIVDDTPEKASALKDKESIRKAKAKDAASSSKCGLITPVRR